MNAVQKVQRGAFKPVTAATAAWRKGDSFCLAVCHAYRRIMKAAGHGLFGGTG